MHTSDICHLTSNISMKGYLTKAFVLRKMDFKEADQIVTLFTEANGKVKAIARGIKKARSRNVGNLELLNLIDVYLVPGNHFEIVTQVKVLKSFQKLKNDLDNISTLYYLTELIDKLIGENESIPSVFNLLEEYLNWSENNPQSVLGEFNLHILEFKLIQILGFAPEIFHCVKCQEKLRAKESKKFSLQLSGIVCEHCGKAIVGIPVSDETIKILRLAQSPDFHFGTKINAGYKDEESAAKSISEYLKWVLARELKTIEVINALKKV